MKKISDKSKIGAAFFLMLLVAIVCDMTTEGKIKNGFIERGEVGEKEEKLELQLDMKEVMDDYTYFIEVQPIKPTKEQAEEYFQKAITQIDQDFVEAIGNVPLEKEYVDGVVKAKWSFQPFGIIDSEGGVYQDKLAEEETVVEASVTLSCGEYEYIYLFSFLLEAQKLSEAEQLLEEIESWMETQMKQEGSDKIQLPSEISGIPLTWSEKKEYLTPQILFLEGVTLVLIWLASRKKKQEDFKKRIAQMEWDYPDIVNQLALLLGAGMTMRQAWHRIAIQYTFKRDAGMIKPRLVNEAILIMNRRLVEGESERKAYQLFAEEIEAPCYRKLMRILLGNLEKGTQGICVQLQEESRQAFEQRILKAKKRGEEASTKMLFPLMLMLMMVMAIIIMPALIEFKI